MKQYSFLIESNDVQKYEDTQNNKPIRIGAALTGAVAAETLTHTLASPVSKSNNQKRPFSNKLPSQLKSLKVNDQNISQYLRDKKIDIMIGGDDPINRIGPCYSPKLNKINLANINDKYMKPMFAHELGHSTGLNPTCHKVYVASKFCSPITAILQVANCCMEKDEEKRQSKGKALSVAGGVGSLPMIAEEIRASIKGTKMLNLHGKDKLKAFIGIGSYISYALSPTIIYNVSEGTRKFLLKLKKEYKENPQVKENIKELSKQDIKVQL